MASVCALLKARPRIEETAGFWDAVGAEALEQEIWAEVRRVLTEPEVVLREQQGPGDTGNPGKEVERLQSELASLGEREERLVRLFGYDEVDSEVVRGEFRDIQRRREVLSNELAALTNPRSDLSEDIDERALRRTCAAVAAHLDGAGSDEQQLVLEAMRLNVEATREEVTIEGILPLEPPKSRQTYSEIITTARTSA